MNDPQDKDARILAMVEEFIDVANRLKNSGEAVPTINTALMLASATYSTYLAAGNDGYLKEGGIRKVSRAYEENLKRVQEIKKATLNPDGAD